MHVSCQFRVWHLRGYKRLLEFLAELGIPLRQSKQKFACMDLELRKHIQEWVSDLTEKYGLSKIIDDTFEASHGFKYKFVASDVVYGVKALLESPNKELSPKEKFMKALDSLSWTKTDVLIEGIELAKLQHSAILKAVHDIIEMKAIESSGPFLHTIIPEGAPDAKLFSYPGCLIAKSNEYLDTPTWSQVFNIFHPFVPIAYRMEPLIDKHFHSIPPCQIPHHKGRKQTEQKI